VISKVMVASSITGIISYAYRQRKLPVPNFTAMFTIPSGTGEVAKSINSPLISASQKVD
jgi:hypothetical protein